MLIEAPALDESEAAVVVDSSVQMAITVAPPQFQAGESLDLGGVQSQTRYTVSCWYRTDLKPSFLFREQCCTQRVFQILSIVPSDRRDAIDMTCVTNG